jgi:hypothetical protein
VGRSILNSHPDICDTHMQGDNGHVEWNITSQNSALTIKCAHCCVTVINKCISCDLDWWPHIVAFC